MNREFLGGFRHKVAKTIYFNAETQTKRYQRKNHYLTRETQTICTDIKSRSSQTLREIGVGKDDEMFMYMITAGSYSSSDEMEIIKKRKVLVLQKVWRGYAIRKKSPMLKAISLKSDEGDNFSCNQACICEEKRDLNINPITKQKLIDQQLSYMSKSIKWKLSSCCIFVETPQTQLIKNFIEIYYSISRANKNVDERLRDLLALKQTIVEYNNSFSMDLCELIDREAILIHQGHNASVLTSLRQRICSLTFSFIEEQYNLGTKTLKN